MSSKFLTYPPVSIGLANNIMLARLASRKAKPAGSYHIHSHDAKDFLAPLDVKDLHGFGRATRQKAEEKLGATNLGELAKKSRAVLCDALGKGTGETLYKALRGVDDRRLESDKQRKSVSCDINVGYCFGHVYAQLGTKSISAFHSTEYVLRITNRQRCSFINWRRRYLEE